VGLRGSDGDGEKEGLMDGEGERRGRKEVEIGISGIGN